MEEANYLSRYGSKVYLIHEEIPFKASKIMVDRARANPKIEFKVNKAVEDMLGENEVTGIKLKDTVTGEIEDIALEGIFVAIGHTPNIATFCQYLKLDPKGYIVTNFRQKPSDRNRR